MKHLPPDIFGMYAPVQCSEILLKMLHGIYLYLPMYIQNYTVNVTESYVKCSVLDPQSEQCQLKLPKGAKQSY